MLWASDVDVAEGTWVKDLHCSLVPLPMLWPSTSVMGLRVLAGAIQTSLADPYRITRSCSIGNSRDDSETMLLD